MKSKKVANSKYKNTGVLFELLVRQVTADTIAGKTISEALEIMQRYFNAKTELGKELQLYRTFFEANRLTETKALHFIDLVLHQRRKLNEQKLAKEKYELIREIKDHYPLKEFLSYKIPDYTIHASIYKTFLTDLAKTNDKNVVNIGEVAQAQFTLVEHLIGDRRSKTATSEDEILKEFRSQSEDLRLLTYKFAVERFNEKYSGLNTPQKNLLREYINNVSNANSLLKYVQEQVPTLRKSLQEKANGLKDRVLVIKLNEVSNQLQKIAERKNIRERELTALMIAYELVKEIHG